MSKKEYQMPVLQVVIINSRYHLLAGSDQPVGKASSNAGLTGSGPDGEIEGNSGGARSRGFSDWDDEY